MPEKKSEDAQQSGQPKWPPSKGPEEYLTVDERSFLRRYLSHPEDLPPEFQSWLVDFIAVNIPQIPISQIVGFSQFTANQSQILASESTTSTSFADLTTLGPQVSGLSAGQYLLLYGATGENSAGSHAYISVSVNGAAAVDADAAVVEPISTTMDFTLMRAVTKTVDEASNSFTLKYKVGAGTGTFYNRWMIVLRIGN